MKYFIEREFVASLIIIASVDTLLSLAVGGEQKNSSCCLKEEYLFLSDTYFPNTLEVQLSEGFTLKSIASVSLWGLKKRASSLLWHFYLIHEPSEDNVLQEQLCHTVVVLEHVMNLMCCHVT